jgi:hypothetical protein
LNFGLVTSDAVGFDIGTCRTKLASYLGSGQILATALFSSEGQTLELIISRGENGLVPKSVMVLTIRGSSTS